MKKSTYASWGPRALVRSLAAVAAMALVSAASSAYGQLAPGAPTDGFTFETWESGLANATDIAFLSDGRAVITLKGGTNGEVVVKQGDMLKRMAATIMLNRGGQNEQGLLGVVVDKDDNLYFYASAGDTANKHKVYKATIGADNVITVNTEMPIVDQGLEGPANHDGGGMIIHKDQLYIGVGDTGNNNTPPTNKYGTCLNKANGKILRVNLDGSVPQDNPLSDVAEVTGCPSRNADFAMLPPDKRIYAWGFRNPWRFWIDPETDLLWIGDVGEGAREEITLGGKGVHHGWPFYEGDVMYNGFGDVDNCMALTPATACTAPIEAYPRDVGQSVTGGLIPPKGCGWGEYESKYFFGDYDSDRMWTLDVNADRRGVAADSRTLFANVAGPTSFRMGPDGAMYIVSHKESSITRLAPKNIPDTCKAAAPPDAGAGSPDAGQGGAGGAMGGGGAAGSGSGGSAGGASGGAAGGSSGGRAGSGGGSSGSGGAGTPAGGGDDGGGCSCDLGGRPPARSGAIWLGLALAAATLGRRRRQRRTR